MDKKDIYEHLAKIYLDASSNKKKKTRSFPPISKKIISLIIFFVIGLSLVLFLKSHIPKPFNSQTQLVLLHDSARMNFNFDPAKKEIYAFDLNKLNISGFKALEFLIKKANYYDTISIRVEFVNAFKEKSEVYLKDISSKWTNYRVELTDFKNLSDWTEITNLTFTVEEWNTRENKGIVYLDNVRLVK